MKRAAVAAAIALTCLACGDSSDAPAPKAANERAPSAAASSAENEAPVIESAQLVPATATADDAVAVEMHADDPDHDRLTTTYEWYRNGELVPDLRDSYVSAGQFARGDRIHAVVYVSDRDHQVSITTSELVIQNAQPRVDSVAITPPRPTGQDLLEAQATGHDGDDDTFSFDYRWYKNNQPIEGVSGPRLPPGSLKRGDQVSVQVVAHDGTDIGPPTTSAAVTIQNSSPLITSQPNYELGASGHYSYDVAAKDPDGDDPLRYELVEAPPGMTVDVTSGRVSWNVPADAKGTYQIELAVSDGYGGKTLQHYALALDWNETPASAGEKGEASNGAAKKKAAKTPGKEAPAARAKDRAAPAKKAKASDEDDTEMDQDQDQEQEPSGEADEE